MAPSQIRLFVKIQSSSTVHFSTIHQTPITYIPVTNLQLLFPTQDEVPSNDIHEEDEYFFDFSFAGIVESAAISGRLCVLLVRYMYIIGHASRKIKQWLFV